MPRGTTFVALTLMACALFVARVAPAQDEPADPKERARLHFERGNTLLADGAVEAALAEFMMSRGIFPTRGNTQNSAVALQKLGRYDEALESYETLERDFPLEPDERKKIDHEIELLHGLVGKVVIHTEPGASISVDGRDRGTAPTPQPLSVSAGSRLVRIVKAGRIPYEKRIEIAGGQTLEINAALPELVEKVERVERPALSPNPPRQNPEAEAHGAPFVGALGGMVLSPGLGGPLADSCGDGCEKRSLPGFALFGRGGYRTVNGIEFGAELGFVRETGGYKTRNDFLEPQGSGEQPGRADDDLAMQGFSLGAFAGYTHGEAWVFHLDLGAGLFLARVDDKRSGRYAVVPVSGAPYTATPQAEQTRNGTYGFVYPEIFGGYALSENVEIGAGLGVMALFAVSPPTYKRDDAVVVQDASGGNELALFRADNLTGSPVFLVIPRVGVIGHL